MTLGNKGGSPLKQEKISPSLEDYLEAILELKVVHGLVRVTDLAEKLGVAKSSVNQAVGKLTAKKLLAHERYGPLELTPLGIDEATKVKERHQLLTCFFNEILGVERPIAESDACHIEHFISPVTMEKLVVFLFALTDCPENIGKFAPQTYIHQKPTDKFPL